MQGQGYAGFFYAVGVHYLKPTQIFECITLKKTTLRYIT
jgi:hypothetical protein